MLVGATLDVLILVVVDDSLVLVVKYAIWRESWSVLILVVVDDSLVPQL